MSALPGKPASNSGDAGSGYEKVLSVPPGERLQKARLERKLEIGEVAEKLNLSPGVVRALEADDYRTLPNSTFVKGYIRSYAREVGLSSDDLVLAFEALTGCDKPVKIEPISPPLITESRGRLKYGVIALVLVGILALGLRYWLHSGPSAPGPQSAQDIVTDPAARIADDDAGGSASTSLPAAAVATDAAGTGTQGADEAKAEATGTAAPAKSEAPTPAAAPAEAKPSAATGQSGANAGQASSASPAPAVSHAEGHLHMTFSGDCWVEVHDANDALVYSALKHAGDAVDMHIAVPANVKLGDGEAATVVFDDKPVNFTTSPNRKVIRLTLGE